MCSITVLLCWKKKLLKILDEIHVHFQFLNWFFIDEMEKGINMILYEQDFKLLFKKWSCCYVSILFFKIYVHVWICFLIYFFRVFLKICSFVIPFLSFDYYCNEIKMAHQTKLRYPTRYEKVKLWKRIKRMAHSKS